MPIKITNKPDLYIVPPDVNKNTKRWEWKMRQKAVHRGVLCWPVTKYFRAQINASVLL